MTPKTEILPSTFIGADFVQSSTGVVDTGNMNAGTIQWWIQPEPASSDTVTLLLQEANENSESAFVDIPDTEHTFENGEALTAVLPFGGFGRFLRVKATTTISAAKGYSARGGLSLKQRR